MVGPPMAKCQLLSVCTKCQSCKLMAQADSQDWKAEYQLLDFRQHIFQLLWITRSI
ncbi:Uncharacterised protein [Mycobacteroides abscessus subsp. abscessus]|nr:Uncharacterised protein [Mycobacteroides abscessus subsp. abscessus]